MQSTLFFVNTLSSDEMYPVQIKDDWPSADINYIKILAFLKYLGWKFVSILSFIETDENVAIIY